MRPVTEYWFNRRYRIRYDHNHGGYQGYIIEKYSWYWWHYCGFQNSLAEARETVERMFDDDSSA
jgi:hypothetical protein